MSNTVYAKCHGNFIHFLLTIKIQIFVSLLYLKWLFCTLEVNLNTNINYLEKFYTQGFL